MRKLLLITAILWPFALNAGLYFDDEDVMVDGINVPEMSAFFADVYEKLDQNNWNNDQAANGMTRIIQSIETIDPRVGISVTGPRMVIVYDDTIAGNYELPKIGKWNDWGELTTAIILNLREKLPNLAKANDQQIYFAVVGAMMNELDPSGGYIYPEMIQVKQQGRVLTSLGLAGVRNEDGYYRITSVIQGSMADNAGLKNQDIVLSINGRQATGMSDEEIIDILEGFTTSLVKLDVFDPVTKAERNVVLRRATIMMADADVIKRDTIIEIVIHQLTKKSVGLIAETLSEKITQATSGIVLDLRTTDGDDEEAMTQIAGLFMGKVPVLQVINVGSDKAFEMVPGGEAIVDSNIPVIVLTSRQTHKLGEALAAAFEENHRGLVVGTPTAGDAKLSKTIPLKNGGQLKITNRQMKTGGGRDLSNRGVLPVICTSSIRSQKQQEVMFVNILNKDFKTGLETWYSETDQSRIEKIRRGCPEVANGQDEDLLTQGVVAQIFSNPKVYDALIKLIP